MLKTMERHFRRPVMVTSGYRSPSYNRKVNGARRSLHMIRAAADIQIDGVSKWEIARFARSMPRRGGVGTYCHTTSVHVDVGPERDWNWRCKRLIRVHRTISPNGKSNGRSFLFSCIFQADRRKHSRLSSRLGSNWHFFQKSVVLGLRVGTFINISPLTPATGAHRLAVRTPPFSWRKQGSIPLGRTTCWFLFLENSKT